MVLAFLSTGSYLAMFATMLASHKSVARSQTTCACVFCEVGAHLRNCRCRECCVDGASFRHSARGADLPRLRHGLRPEQAPATHSSLGSTRSEP